MRVSSSGRSIRRGWLSRKVVRTVSRVTPGGRLGPGALEDEGIGRPEVSGVAVTEGVAGVPCPDVGVDVDVGVAVEVGDGVSVGVVGIVGVVEGGVSVGIGVGVLVWRAGAASATPVRRATLDGTARARMPACRTNARRVIRRSHTRVIVAVRRFTECAPLAPRRRTRDLANRCARSLERAG
jgi:hypothetical protein